MEKITRKNTNELCAIETLTELLYFSSSEATIILLYVNAARPKHSFYLQHNLKALIRCISNTNNHKCFRLIHTQQSVRNTGRSQHALGMTTQ